MRLGFWRAAACAAVLFGGLTSAASAHIIRHTIPRLTPAMDYRTGGRYYAPPIPYGHYAKDPVGAVHGVIECIYGKACGLFHGHCGHCGGLFHKKCGSCGGAGCGHCFGSGLFHGEKCGSCGGAGCGQCGQSGPFLGMADVNDPGHGHIHQAGLSDGMSGAGVVTAGGPIGAGQLLPDGPFAGGLSGPDGLVGPGEVIASGQQPSPGPIVIGDPVCGACGGQGCGACGGKGGLFHHGRKAACGACGGAGCGLCGKGKGGHGLRHHGGNGDPCGACGGAGCGLCGKGKGDPCGACGGKGCGLCKGGAKGCGFCGGKGCGHCLGRIHGLLGAAGRRLGIGGIQYFVGPGGPVPLTPGYVNYVVPTRSPRDYFAFPPFVNIDP